MREDFYNEYTEFQTILNSALENGAHRRGIHNSTIPKQQEVNLKINPHCIPITTYLYSLFSNIAFDITERRFSSDLSLLSLKSNKMKPKN